MLQLSRTAIVLIVALLLAALGAHAAGGREIPLLSRTSGGAYSPLLTYHAATCDVYPDRVVATLQSGPVYTTTVTPITSIDVDALRTTIEQACQHPMTEGKPMPADAAFTHYFASLYVSHDVKLKTLEGAYRVVVNECWEARALRLMLDRLCPPAIPEWDEPLYPGPRRGEQPSPRR